MQYLFIEYNSATAPRKHMHGPGLISGGGGGEGGNLRVILVRVCGPVFETYPNHIPGLRKKMTYSYT